MLGILVFFPAAYAQEGEDDSVNPLGAIIHLDREIAALFDAYFQAVPSCPVNESIEVNNWIMDIALLRASFAYRNAIYLPHSPDSIVNNAWVNYLDASLEYITLFSTIQKIYHNTVLPDSTVCVNIENELLLCDSLWSIRETELFQILAEKGITYEQSE